MRSIHPFACLAMGLVLVVGVRGPAIGHDPTPTATPPDPGQGHEHGSDQAHDDDTPHVHAPVPGEYRTAHVPAAAWTLQPLIARGKDIYAARCAVCHGDDGDGKGPAAAGLPLKPPSFTDPKMVGEMAGNYWFWRVSEGGLVEPFKSMGSVMPAWKQELSVEDRWAVIAYTHRFSGHLGPHVTSEHPQMLMAGHGAHGGSSTGSDPKSGAPPATTGSPAQGGHGHGSHGHGSGAGGTHKH